MRNGVARASIAAQHIIAVAWHIENGINKRSAHMLRAMAAGKNNNAAAGDAKKRSVYEKYRLKISFGAPLEEENEENEKKIQRTWRHRKARGENGSNINGAGAQQAHIMKSSIAPRCSRAARICL